MKRRSVRWRLCCTRVCALSIAFLLHGCSWIFVKPAPDSGSAALRAKSDCTTSYVAPIVDGAAILTSLVVGGFFVPNGNESLASADGAVMIGSLGLAAVLGFSEYYGWTNVSRCGLQHETNDIMARNETTVTGYGAGAPREGGGPQKELHGHDSSLSLEGESCTRTSDCERGLGCVGGVCRERTHYEDARPSPPLTPIRSSVVVTTDPDARSRTQVEAAIQQGKGTFHSATGETVVQANANLVWQRSDSRTKLDWDDAKGFCAKLGLAGGGWRLPTIEELVALIDSTRKKGVRVDAAFVNSGKDFWSGSPRSGGDKVWLVDFDEGADGFGAVNELHKVRCVRSTEVKW